MKSILRMLFHNYIIETEPNEFIKLLDSEIENNKKRLKLNFNKKQRKLLLRIIDAKDLIREEANQESFIAGFKMGLKIGYESNND